MQTIAARSVNEMYRSRLLQLVITYHGGMQAIGYNWGSFNYYRGSPHRSPDDTSQREISQQMSRCAPPTTRTFLVSVVRLTRLAATGGRSASRAAATYRATGPTRTRR